jgi:hypothetical protein
MAICQRTIKAAADFNARRWHCGTNRSLINAVGEMMERSSKSPKLHLQSIKGHCCDRSNRSKAEEVEPARGFRIERQ